MSTQAFTGSGVTKHFTAPFACSLAVKQGLAPGGNGAAGSAGLGGGGGGGGEEINGGFVPGGGLFVPAGGQVTIAFAGNKTTITFPGGKQIVSIAGSPARGTEGGAGGTGGSISPGLFPTSTINPGGSGANPSGDAGGGGGGAAGNSPREGDGGNAVGTEGGAAGSGTGLAPNGAGGQGGSSSAIDGRVGAGFGAGGGGGGSRGLGGFASGGRVCLQYIAVSPPDPPTATIALPFPSQAQIPWPETVVVTSVFSNPASNIIQTVTDAGVYQLGNTEGAPSQGVYTKFKIKVTIGQSDVPFTPKPADTVLWLGNTYTVQRVQGYDWLEYYELEALNLILAYQLVQSGNLKRPTNAVDATSKLTFATYTPIAANIPCRLQPMTGDAVDIGKRRTMPQRFTAYLGIQVVPQAKDVFTVAGQDYTVLNFRNPERIDEVQTLQCELIG
jgi:hypothetical protein